MLHQRGSGLFQWFQCFDPSPCFRIQVHLTAGLYDRCPTQRYGPESAVFPLIQVLQFGNVREMPHRPMYCLSDFEMQSVAFHQPPRCYRRMFATTRIRLLRWTVQHRRTSCVAPAPAFQPLGGLCEYGVSELDGPRCRGQSSLLRWTRRRGDSFSGPCCSNGRNLKGKGRRGPACHRGIWSRPLMPAFRSLMGPSREAVTLMD